MKELLDKIFEDLNFLKDNTNNPFIISTCNKLIEQMTQVVDRKFITQDALDYFCNYIIDKDINKMKRVISSESKTEYKIMDELAELISQIKIEYFKE